MAVENLEVPSNDDIDVLEVSQGIIPIPGPPGEKGDKGDQGEPGPSAYDVAVAGGFIGTIDNWLSSLKGEQGARGSQGNPGRDGQDGARGPTGATGATGSTGAQGPKGDKGDTGATGPAGTPGESAYALAQDQGYSGTLAQWLASLQGPQGITGTPGAKGDPGATGATGAKGDKGDTGSTGATGLKGDKGDTGSRGSDGTPGANGKSAYEIAVIDGFVGTEVQWLASLVGSQGPKGDIGTTGATGTKGDKGDAGATGSQGEKGDKGDSGPKGDTGDAGAAGPAGPGVPLAGALHYILSKASTADLDTTWVDVNDLVDWDRVASMIATAIANSGGGTTNPGGGDDGGTDPGDGGTTDPGDGGNTGGGGDDGTGLLTTRWTANGLASPITPTGHFTAPFTLETVADGTSATADGNLIILNKGSFLDAQSLPFGLATDGDDTKAQTPAVFRIGIKGIIGPDFSTLVDVSRWAVGQFTFSTSWTGTNLRTTMGRNGNGELIDSDDASLNFGSNELYEVEWRDDPTATGGFMRFFVGGVQIGSEKPTSMKFRAPDDMEICVNATLGNTSGSVDGLTVEYVEIGYQA